MYGQGLMSETAVVWPRSAVRDGGCMAKVCCQRRRLYGQGLLSETAVVWPRSAVRDGGCMAKVCCQRRRLYGQGLLSETAVVWPRSAVRDGGCMAKVCCQRQLHTCCRPEGRNWFSSRPVNHGGYGQRDATRLRQVLLVLQDCCRRRE